MQVILVIIVIFWPGSVTYWLDAPTVTEPSKLQIQLPSIGGPGGIHGLDLPPLTLPKDLAPAQR